MQHDRVRFGAFGVAVAVAVALGTPGAASAQIDVSGTWAMSVMTDQGTTTPSVTLEQDGNVLTGRYSSATLGEADVTGTVEGSEITFSFDADLQGQSVPVTYKATVEGGEMSGTIDLAGGMMTGSFTARRETS